MIILHATAFIALLWFAFENVHHFFFFQNETLNNQEIITSGRNHPKLSKKINNNVAGKDKLFFGNIIYIKF